MAGRHDHCEIRLDNSLIKRQLQFRQAVSMAKYHVANMLWRIIDRAIPVHGALGYSTDAVLERMMRHARSRGWSTAPTRSDLSQIVRQV